MLRNHFLACEIHSGVAARTYLERNKVALQVKCSWRQHVQGQHSGYQHRALLQSKLLEPAVVKSVHTCRRIFLSFSFCCTCKRFIGFYSTTPTPSSPGFKRMNWAQLLSSSFFLFFFFAFHRFSKVAKKKKKHLAIVSLMMFVFGCVQKLASKIASFFFLRLNF